MAEAAVEERPLARFYCHMCDVEFQSVASNCICPHCADGFIEELQDTDDQQSRARDFSSNSTWDDEDMEELLLADRLMDNRTENGGPSEGRGSFHPLSANLRHSLPIEHLVHDFIINLGVGVNWGGQGNVQFFLGNPGDYAWGREGLDAIVTQLLNQMDSTGPPPLSKAVIDALQVVEVTDEQVGQNMQCSVCWEHFQLKEQVRQLPCTHIYHENCIRPWLELHGTCPICRQNLGGDGEGSSQNEFNQAREDIANIDARGQVASVQNVLRSLFGSPSAAPSSSNQMDQSGSSSSRTQNGDSTM